MSKFSWLGGCLTDKYGLSPEEADAFVESLFALIREKLLSDHVVKVRGLGSFKLTEMNARESVNISTGERITIVGRYKLTFTPENAVRDRINSPFAPFESIDINGNVDFSAIDAKYGEEKETETMETESVEDVQEQESETTDTNPSLDEEAPTESVVESEVDSEAEPMTEGKAGTESVSEAEPETSSVEDDKPEVETVEEEPKAEPVHETETTASDSEPQTVSNPDVELKAAPTVRSPYCETLIREEIHHSRAILLMLRWLLGLVIAAIVVGGAYFFYNMGREKATSEYYQHLKEEARKEAERERALQARIDAMKAAQKAEADSVAAEARKDSLKQELPESAGQHQDKDAKKPLQKSDEKAEVKKDAKKDAKAASSDTADYNNKDVRVRTGAYNIIGLDAVVTVRQGQTLKSLAKYYLGEGMECYLEVYNGGKTEFKVGDKVKIPKLKLKKKRK